MLEYSKNITEFFSILCTNQNFKGNFFVKENQSFLILMWLRYMKTNIFVPTIDGHRSKKGIDILFHVSFPMSQGIAGVIANFLKLIFII